MTTLLCNTVPSKRCVFHGIDFDQCPNSPPMCPDSPPPADVYYSPHMTPSSPWEDEYVDPPKIVIDLVNATFPDPAFGGKVVVLDDDEKDTTFEEYYRYYLPATCDLYWGWCGDDWFEKIDPRMDCSLLKHSNLGIMCDSQKNCDICAEFEWNMKSHVAALKSQESRKRTERTDDSPVVSESKKPRRKNRNELSKLLEW
jgi:hypothetical protein